MTITSRLLRCGAVMLALFVVVSVGLTRPKDQEAENACDNAYNVCYNNCKGKPDVCYSNCDTVYLHCLRGAGVINAQANAPLKKHPPLPTPTPRVTASINPVQGTINKQLTQPSPSATPATHHKHGKG